jgi:Clp amino terminal domain, pathogenicity island component/ClpX C4-type zinc finger
VFERFTDRARRVIVLAQEEARLLDHNYIGTEHVLLGLIHEGEGVAARALESLDISLGAVRAQVEEIIGQGDTAPVGHIPFTPRAKKVLELSLREALQLGHNYIGTEHILLGLIREGEGVAAQVLVRLGADLATVRTRVILILSGHPRVGTPAGTRVGAFQVAHAPRCSFCGREVSEVAHYAQGTGAAICDECIVVAYAALEGAADEDRILVFPPRVVGAAPITDPPAAAQIVRAFDELPQIRGVAVRLIEVRFVSPDVAELRYNLSVDEVGDDIPWVGIATRTGSEWLVADDLIPRALRDIGIELPPGA